MTMHVNSAVLQVSNNDNVLTFEPNEVSKKDYKKVHGLRLEQ